MKFPATWFVDSNPDGAFYYALAIPPRQFGHCMGFNVICSDCIADLAEAKYIRDSDLGANLTSLNPSATMLPALGLVCHAVSSTLSITCV